MIRKFLTLVFMVCTAAMLALTPADAFTYSGLENYLKNDRLPGQKKMDDLPEPTEAHHYFLLSRVESDLDRALDYLESALAGAGEKRGKYLLHWVRLVNLKGPEKSELDFLENQLQKIEEKEEQTSGRLWLTAGILAREINASDRAQKWLETAREFSETEAEAILELAEMKLDGDELARAKKLLEDYFVNFENGNRPRFWLLKGRLFEKQGADSEAYVTYSHVIQNYPESMLLPVAEEQIEDLRLPEELVAGVKEKNVSAQQLIDSPPQKREKKTAKEPEPYWVQIGSFQDESRAKNLRLRAEKQFTTGAEVVEATVEGSTYYRVQVGGFSTKSEAQKMKAKLQSKGMEGWVITR
ncbi:MAG: SPOR domain-containing protein [bacterium]